MSSIKMQYVIPRHTHFIASSKRRCFSTATTTATSCAANWPVAHCKWVERSKLNDEREVTGRVFGISTLFSRSTLRLLKFKHTSVKLILYTIWIIYIASIILVGGEALSKGGNSDWTSEDVASAWTTFGDDWWPAKTLYLAISAKKSLKY